MKTKNNPYVKTKKAKQPKQTFQKKTTNNQSANEPIDIPLDDQLERFADILLDLFLTHHNEAKENN